MVINITGKCPLDGKGAFDGENPLTALMQELVSCTSDGLPKLVFLHMSNIGTVLIHCIYIKFVDFGSTE